MVWSYSIRSILVEKGLRKSPYYRIYHIYSNRQAWTNSVDPDEPVSVAQLDAPSDWRQHSFMEIDHEIFSTVILSLPLIQEGQLSVSGERMCTILVNRLED